MKTWSPSKRLFVAAILSIAASNCGNSSSGTVQSGGSMSGTGGFKQGGAPSGGSTATGGVQATGGAMGTGGTTTGGGTPGTGGMSTGGVAKTGGSTGSGGVSTSGGSMVTGGTTRTGGTSITGGTTASGGAMDAGIATGGMVDAATGDTRRTGGSATGGSTATGGQTAPGQRPISFGTLLDAQAVMTAAQTLAKSQANPSGAQWQAKGDQRRTYKFTEANTTAPYRLCVPSTWDGQSKLPLAMFLHGAGNNESSYLDANNKLMITLAEQNGYLLVSPLGDQGAYGNFLRLSAPFGDEAGAAELMSQVTTASERTNQLSEKDVINVLEIVLNEYPIDRAAMFLMGHSMGSGGTWYIGGKYPGYWKGIAPLSGPFVQKTGYPWDGLRKTYIFVTEGTLAPSLEASRLLRDWLKANNFLSEYKEVTADHGGMVPMVLPDVFAFFVRVSKL